MPFSHLILCHPLLLLPPIPPSIRVFSNESALHMRWPKYWSFSFIISPSKEHPGQISFRMDWLDLLAVQEILKSLLQEVKWTLESITMNKASGGDGIPVELFQILKDDAVKVLQYASKFGKRSSGHRTGKGQFSFQSQRKAVLKNAQNTTQLHSSHMPAK